MTVPDRPAVPLCDRLIRDEEDGDEVSDICGRLSRFRIERPGDGYTPSESCEEHLADQVVILLEGEDVTASVTVHWDEP